VGCRRVKAGAGAETQPPLGDITVNLARPQNSESGKGKHKDLGVMPSGEAGIRVRLNMSEVQETQANVVNHFPLNSI
jgi:hypothetical protein